MRFWGGLNRRLRLWHSSTCLLWWRRALHGRHLRLGNHHRRLWRRRRLHSRLWDRSRWLCRRKGVSPALVRNWRSFRLRSFWLGSFRFRLPRRAAVVAAPAASPTLVVLRRGPTALALLLLLPVLPAGRRPAPAALLVLLATVPATWPCQEEPGPPVFPDLRHSCLLWFAGCWSPAQLLEEEVLLEEELLRPRRLFFSFSLRRCFFSFFNFFLSFSIFFLSFLALFFSAPLRFRLAMATAAGPEAPKGFLKNNLEEKHCHKTAAPQVAARVPLLHSSCVNITAARDRLQRLHQMLKSQLCKSFLDSGEPFAGPPKASPFQVPPGCTISRSPKSTTSRLATH